MIRKLRLNLPAINGGTDTAIATSIAPYYAYKDGKITDVQLGWRYNLLLQNAGYERIVCKVEGLKPCVSQEELEEKNGVLVRPMGFVGKFYRNNAGEYLFTSSADKMEVV